MSSKSSFEPSASQRPRSRLRLVGLVALIVVFAIVVAGVATRATEGKRLRAWTTAQATPTVVVAPPAVSAASALELPGRLEAYARAPIFARVSGYLKSWKVDIGTPVKAGQLLAVIETPDLDQQLLQARADLASAVANENLAATTAKRWTALLASHAVARQDVDEKTGDYAAKQALTNSERANLAHIEATKAFARIVAPFDGVVTARSTDVGALINEGSGSGVELFEVSDTHKLRMYVQVPQSDVPAIVTGLAAKLTVPERPGRSFTARVESSAQAVSATSGTTLVQLSVDNQDGLLLPGSFASVHFDLPVDTAALRVPASALVFNDKGLRVATVGNDDRVTFKDVTIVRDYGTSVQIGSGLGAGDRVIESPPDGLVDGDRVEVAKAEKIAKT
jgi:RND family efflux transporter MFP subunit